MFFRREKPRVLSFEERLENLRKLGVVIKPESGGRVRVSREKFAAMVSDAGDGRTNVENAGVLLDSEIATLVHGGYQMFLRTPSGKVAPALAEDLKGLHAFEEDLRESLGLVSLYNLSLGTICDSHSYDRVEGREPGQRNGAAH